MTTMDKWAYHAYALAKQAGQKIMTFYTDELELIPEYKDDNSPLTLADKAAHDIIFQGLKDYILDENGPAPVLSEEGAPILYEERRTWQRYWCVDPLDGTREFLAHNDEFAVNIALIENHHPIVGAIYVPALKRGYLAWHHGGAYLYDEFDNERRIVTKKPPNTPLRLVVSNHCDPIELQSYLANLGEVQIQYQGSALKFGCLASGEADLMLRLSATSEWDNAAGQCLVEQAGGVVMSLQGQPLAYNRSGSLLHGNFLAAGDSTINWLQNLNKVSS